MSYDISLQADLGGPHPVSVGWLSENYTWNLGEFFEWFLGARLGDFHGKEASALCAAISSGYEKFQGSYNHPPPSLEKLKSFEPDNGWGSVLGALAFLHRVYRACILAPEAIVCVH